LDLVSLIVGQLFGAYDLVSLIVGQLFGAYVYWVLTPDPRVIKITTIVSMTIVVIFLPS
jgi:hypothetical protein